MPPLSENILYAMLKFIYISKKIVNFKENIISNTVKGTIKKSKLKERYTEWYSS